MYMKKVKFKFMSACLLFTLVAMSVPLAAMAHVLKEDNGISAVLHIPPEDNPVSGHKTELDLSFSDANNFSLTYCKCKVLVKDSGKLITHSTPVPAVAGATLDAIAYVTFPSSGVYDVIIDGKATSNQFHDFSLDYLVRVTGQNNQTNNYSSGYQVLIVGSGALIILFIIAYQKIKYGGRYH